MLTLATVTHLSEENVLEGAGLLAQGGLLGRVARNKVLEDTTVGSVGHFRRLCSGERGRGRDEMRKKKASTSFFINIYFLQAKPAPHTTSPQRYTYMSSLSLVACSLLLL